ncbi:Carboxy-lyase [Sarracenia purpurea var. burkii]
MAFKHTLPTISIGGIHPENCRLLKTDVSTEYALSPKSLNEAISHDIAVGLVPFFLCASVSYEEFPMLVLLHQQLLIRCLDWERLPRVMECGSMWMLLMLEVLAYAQNFAIILMALKKPTHLI